MILVLLTLLIILLAFEFLVLKDVLAPSFVVTAVFAFACVTVVIEYNNLYYKVGVRTALIVFLGLLAFFLIEIIVRIFQNRKIGIFSAENASPIIIRKWKIYFLIVFDIVILFATIYEVKRVATLGGYHTGSLVNDYKLISSFSTALDDEERFSGFLAQLTKVSMIGAYICVLSILHNMIICRIRLKEMLIYFLPIVLWLPLPALKGGRLDIIQFVIACWVFAYVIYQMKCGWNLKMSIRFLKKILKFLPVFFLAFYALKLIMGIGSETKIWKYIFSYTGANVVNFEAYLQHPVSKSDIWGEETFYRIYNALRAVGLSNHKRFTAHLEFRLIEKGLVDNCYTFFRRPLHDFGYAGMFAAIMLVSLFYSAFYYKHIKNIHNQDYRLLLIYGFIFMPIPLFACEFYVGNIITLGNIFTMFLMNVMYLWLTDQVKIYLKKR